MNVCLNSPGYSYDVHSLVKAFYPDRDVAVTDKEEDGSDITVFVSSGDIANKDRASGYLCVSANGPEGLISKKEEYRELSRFELKNLLKRKLYEVLSVVSDKELPWGTMTGIRPVKVPMKMIREGRTDEDISDHMRSVYLCSQEKTQLAINIAHTEKGILDSLGDDGFGLYVGIPFCPTTCLYCSFTSYPISSWEKRTDEYIDAVKREIVFFADHYRGRYADCIYIGGGTPTTLSAAQLEDLIGYIGDSFDLSRLSEFTVEAGRPDSITDEKLKVLKSSGVDRISINPQTMNDKTLRLIGRRHTSDDVYKAFEAARAAGFTNINTDLILGLPGEDESDVEHTFSEIKKLSPESITIHSLAIKRAAAMHSFLDEHEKIVSRNTPEMMKMASELAASMGLDPYYLYRQKNMTGNFENVGYAKSGCYGIYNVAIMEEVTDIAAVGAGTISKRVFADERIERCDNVKDVSLYIDRIGEMIEKKKKLFS